MKPMIPFRLNIELGTPMSITETVTLDALLSKAVFNMTGFRDDRISDMIPLATNNEVFCGSILRVAGNARNSTVSFVRKLTRDDMASSKHQSNVQRGENKGGYTYIETARGPFCTKLESIRVVEAQRVYFYGLGHPDEVIRLIENFLPGIGKRANAGLGEIRSVSWTPSPDYSLIDKDGWPARPMPVADWDALHSITKKANPVVAMRPIAVPGWCNEKVACVMPV